MEAAILNQHESCKLNCEIKYISQKHAYKYIFDNCNLCLLSK